MNIDKEYAEIHSELVNIDTPCHLVNNSVFKAKYKCILKKFEQF